MGKKSTPAPAPAAAAPAPTVTPTEASASPDDGTAARAAARRAQDAETARASLLDNSGASGDVDPLTQKKTLTAGSSAGLMG